MSALAAIPQLVRYISFMDGYRMLFYNLYQLTELFFCVWLFSELLHRSFAMKIVTVGYVLLFACIYSILLTKFDIKSRFFNECVCITQLYIVSCVLKIVYSAVYNGNLSTSLKKPENYYVLGFFFYAPFTVLIYALWQFLMQHKNSPLQNVWIIHHVCNALMYCIFGLGIYLDSRNTGDKLKANPN